MQLTRRWIRLLSGVFAVTCIYIVMQLILLPPSLSSNNDGSILRIDWTDVKLVQSEAMRSGNGEQGRPFHLSADLEAEKQSLYRSNGFNALASDHIALNRSIPDIRNRACHSKLFAAKLPRASVIIPFYNEHLSTLLRSVYSILNRSPHELLEEIILADDLSDKSFLGSELDDYIAKHWPDGRVKVVRTKERQGLIRARLMGARVAKSQVLIFLDSHSECNINWLPPLLEPIAIDPHTVVCPFVDVIDYDTFEYRAQDEGARGAFDWQLFYKRLPLLPESLIKPAEPFDNPVMAGGYFAIDRDWFWQLGGYDEGLEIWGGEQYELSFKIWMCHGRMVDAPCSRVGHIYRKFSPFLNAGKGDFIGRNYKRVAEVWMDEYKEYIYNQRPHYKQLDAGDLTKQKQLRIDLKCKSFKWFMTEIAFDLVKKYPPVEPPPLAEGDLRNVANNLCIDTNYRGQDSRFELARCVRDDPNVGGGEQYMIYGENRDLHPRKRLMCFDVSRSNQHAPVLLYPCHNQLGNQEWQYRLPSRQLYHPVSQLCMDTDPDRVEIFMAKCNEHSKSQQWIWQKLNTSTHSPL